MSATVWSSRPSAASGRSWKSLAKALSLKISGAIFWLRKPRQRPGRARIAGDAGGGRNPLRGEALQAILDERRLAVEEMRDAGNVEHQPVGAIERGERRKAGAPVAEPLQEPRLFRGRRLDGDEGGKARARIGEREAAAQAQPRGFGVDADEPLRVVDLATAASGAALSTRLRRRARSVARRGSQRERNRRIVKSHVLA